MSALRLKGGLARLRDGCPLSATNGHQPRLNRSGSWCGDGAHVRAARPTRVGLRQGGRGLPNPPEQQTAFARKANWYRVLARLSEKNERATGQVTTPPELLKPKQSRLGAAFKRLLTLAS